MQVSSFSQLQEEGDSIYTSIPLFRHIVEFMENPLTRQFYNEYLNPVTLRSTMMCLWLYEEIEHRFPVSTPQERIVLLHEWMHTKKMVSHSIRSIIHTIEN